ncbi:MAG: hypothetical protein KC496_19655 [Anaerolineae bacterium]|nr:hypothetical protein [Anaerolineae bacterium]
MYEIPEDLSDLTRELVSLRKKPSTQERFKSYPAMLQRFNELLETCDDAATLKEVLRLDEGYYLLAGYRQRVIEKLLTLERTPAILRAYALQLEIFGDVDEYGEANTDIEERIEALFAEADRLE